MFHNLKTHQKISFHAPTIARKRILLKALVFEGCLINHLVTSNILQQNSAVF